MEWVETTGRSIAEAKEAALDQLGVDEADAEFEVLSEPKSGFFGRLKAEARVRARVRPAVPRSKENPPRRRRRHESAGETQESPKRKKTEAPASVSEKEESTADTSGAGSTARKRKPRNRRPSKPRPTPNEGAQEMEEEVALAQQGEVAERFVAGLLEKINVHSQISVDVDEEEGNVLVGIAGEQLGHLIGPRGSSLHALQELTRTVVQRKTGARTGRILVDINSYREKRKEALARFARQVAEEVVSTGSQRVLEPMSPPDRKVVHDAVGEIEGVITTSEGEEPRRRVAIKPAQ